MKIRSLRWIVIHNIGWTLALSLITGCGGGGTSSGGDRNKVAVDIADPTLKAIAYGALKVLDAEDRAFVEKHTHTIEAKPLPGFSAVATSQGVTTLTPAFLRRYDVYQIAGVLVHEAVHHQQGRSSSRSYDELQREAYQRQLMTLRKLNADTAWIERLLIDPACCSG